MAEGVKIKSWHLCTMMHCEAETMILGHCKFREKKEELDHYATV